MQIRGYKFMTQYTFAILFFLSGMHNNVTMKSLALKAVFADIDGTLYSHETNSVPESARTALKMLKEAGVRTFACTGRCMAEIRDMNMQDVELDGWLTMNGAYSFAEDGFVYRCPVDPADVRTFVTACREYDYPCMFLEEDRMYISRYDDEVQKMQDAIHTPMPPVCDPRRALEHTVYMVIPYAEEETWQKTAARLKHVKYTRWNELAVDVFHESCDKARAVAETCRHYGWTKEEIAGIGDGPNDLSLLAACGTSVAMGNACEEVKQAADFVSDDIEDDGFYKAVCRLLDRREKV